jgi:hypothetical protein
MELLVVSNARESSLDRQAHSSPRIVWRTYLLHLVLLN